MKMYQTYPRNIYTMRWDGEHETMHRLHGWLIEKELDKIFSLYLMADTRGLIITNKDYSLSIPNGNWIVYSAFVPIKFATNLPDSYFYCYTDNDYWAFVLPLIDSNTNMEKV